MCKRQPGVNDNVVVGANGAQTLVVGVAFLKPRHQSHNPNCRGPAGHWELVGVVGGYSSALEVE